MKFGIYILSGVVGLAAGVLLGAFVLFKIHIEPVTSTLNMEGESVLSTNTEPEEVALEVKGQEEKLEVGVEIAPEDLPDRVQLEVPFTSQAPYGNWGEPYQESCEEASLIMAYNFWEEDGLNASSSDSQIQQMVAWENANLGFYKDTNIEQTARIAEKYYGYKATITYDPTPEDIKAALAAGNPVIVPSAGRELGNPNFTPPGPWYHMLVITGYDGDTFITNDPGTRSGEDYTYHQDVLMAAIHDYPGTKELTGTGTPAMLVIQPAQ